MKTLGQKRTDLSLEALLMSIAGVAHLVSSPCWCKGDEVPPSSSSSHRDKWDEEAAVVEHVRKGTSGTGGAGGGGS